MRDVASNGPASSGAKGRDMRIFPVFGQSRAAEWASFRAGRSNYDHELNVDYDPEVFNCPPRIGPDAWHRRAPR